MLLILLLYAWIYLNKQGSEYARVFNMPGIYVA